MKWSCWKKLIYCPEHVKAKSECCKSVIITPHHATTRLYWKEWTSYIPQSYVSKNAIKRGAIPHKIYKVFYRGYGKNSAYRWLVPINDTVFKYIVYAFIESQLYFTISLIRTSPMRCILNFEDSRKAIIFKD